MSKRKVAISIILIIVFVFTVSYIVKGKIYLSSSLNQNDVEELLKSGSLVAQYRCLNLCHDGYYISVEDCDQNTCKHYYFDIDGATANASDGKWAKIKGTVFWKSKPLIRIEESHTYFSNMDENSIIKACESSLEKRADDMVKRISAISTKEERVTITKDREDLLSSFLPLSKPIPDYRGKYLIIYGNNHLETKVNNPVGYFYLECLYDVSNAKILRLIEVYEKYTDWM